MPTVVELPAFWVGAIVFLLSQWGKFCEFGSISGNALDARPTLILRLKPRDLTDAQTFHLALVAFLLVSLFIYFLLCLLPSGVVNGWTKLETGKALSASMGEPQLFPLLIASALIGITQPIPVFDKIANLQREVFHNWIGIPEVVQATAAYYSQDIFVRASTSDLLSIEIQKMLDDMWIDKIAEFSDIRFYKNHIERTGLDKPASYADVLAGSVREKKFVIQELVLAACIAGVRRSGGKSLEELARALVVKPLKVPSNPSRLRGGLLIVLLCIIVLWPVLPLPILRDWIQSTFSITNRNFWPQNLYASGQYLIVNFVPMIISVLLVVLMIRPNTMATDEDRSRNLNPSLYQLLNEYSLYIISIFIMMIVYIYLQALFDIGNSTGNYPYNNFDFVRTRIPYFLLQALVPAIGAYILIVYISRPDLRENSAGRMGWATLLVLVAITASAFNAIVRAQYQFDANNQPQLDFILLVVGLNALSAIVAFLLASLAVRPPRVA